MTKLGEIIDLVQPKFNEGGEYLWDCYGPDCWSVEIKPSSSLVYNVNTCQVFEFCIYDIDEDQGNIVHMWIDPDYRDKYHEEYKRRVGKENNWEYEYHDDLISMIGLLEEGKK